MNQGNQGNREQGMEKNREPIILLKFLKEYYCGGLNFTVRKNDTKWVTFNKAKQLFADFPDSWELVDYKKVDFVSADDILTIAKKKRELIPKWRRSS